MSQMYKKSRSTLLQYSATNFNTEGQWQHSGSDSWQFKSECFYYDKSNYTFQIIHGVDRNMKELLLITLSRPKNRQSLCYLKIIIKIYILGIIYFMDNLFRSCSYTALSIFQTYTLLFVFEIAECLYKNLPFFPSQQ